VNAQLVRKENKFRFRFALRAIDCGLSDIVKKRSSRAIARKPLRLERKFVAEEVKMRFRATLQTIHRQEALKLRSGDASLLIHFPEEGVVHRFDLEANWFF